MPNTATPSPFLANPSIGIGLALMLCCAAAPVAALKPTNITEGEFALLPKYCADTQGFGYNDAHFNTSPRAAGWVAQMGKSFWDMHHYCWGLINQRRATRVGVPPMLRNGRLEDVLSDYQYVVNKASPGFILLPEIYTRIGEVELLLARPNKANEAFARARKQKPDYWPAYSRWAEFLIRSGKRPEAKELVKSGLEYSPTATVLLEQYRLLGGKPSEIVAKAIPVAQGPEVEKTKPDSAPSVDGNAGPSTGTTKSDDAAK